MGVGRVVSLEILVPLGALENTHTLCPVGMTRIGRDAPVAVGRLRVSSSTHPCYDHFMDLEELEASALRYNPTLTAAKSAIRDVDWYPYGSIGNFTLLKACLTGGNRDLLKLAGGRPVLDIGGADGDVSFYLETLGLEVDFLDNASTNNNQMKGVRRLKDALRSEIHIYETDLDSQFSLPRKNYGLIFFLGTLYHLKNPFYTLEALAKSTRYCLISTRIARMSLDKQTNFADQPMAYLLDAHECNNDATNYWIFTEPGLRRILARTGWNILDYSSFGNTVDSDPATSDGDERAYCLVESTVAAH